ncbi:F-box protein [Apostasia shenzhenica]|uniref:F-box protein n=1 Tax=Apostasia shenzhenica TaxID=1088818 RepID=A0A2I0B9Y3_9ASPA|nr:F-box protein [Apostasia shenzhenica]
MGIQIGAKVDRVDGRQLSYGDFVERYVKRNLPVVLTGLMTGWRASADWVTADGRPNLRFFADHFGKSMVQVISGLQPSLRFLPPRVIDCKVAECNKRDFTDQKRVEMLVSEYIKYWLSISSTEDNDISNCSSSTESLLYLKDWHFVQEYPDYVAYRTPSFFLNDWLNLYLESHCLHRDPDINQDKNEMNCADYRFVYMGPKGTWTPLHADVFRSYSWSANICGRKHWLFLPPSQCHLIFDRYLKSSVYDVYGDVCEKKYPGFNKAIWWECTQEPNEIIFIPSGWYHQVLNLEDTISVNHNWFNSYNLSWVWNLLTKDYIEAKGYIEDVREICDDFESICQRNLAANSGMNFYDFLVFITRFALANVALLMNLSNEEGLISYILNSLENIHAVASGMVGFEAFSEDNFNSCSEVNRTAFSDVKQITEDLNFHELCSDLRLIYRTICNGQHLGKVMEVLEMIDFTELSGLKIIAGPADLVKVIENAIPIGNRCDISSLP